MGLLALGQRSRFGRRRRLRTPAGVVVTVGTWDQVPGMASMVITGAHDPQTEDGVDESVVRGWVSAMTRWGFTSVRTNALTPGLARTLHAVGFSIAQDLRLLERSTSDWTPGHGDNVPVSAVDPRRTGIGRGRIARTLSEIIRIDRASFPLPWTLDRDSMRDALRATPMTRVFLAESDRVGCGFVIVGLNGRAAYVQRLAVDPAYRRFGWASVLMTRALDWAADNGAQRVFVNTETGNDAALGLYGNLGFRSTPLGLFVMQRELP